MNKEINFLFERQKMQTLADLGFDKESRNTLSPKDIDEIIKNNTSYQSFKEKQNKIEEPQDFEVSEEIKERYKKAYENLEGIRESLIFHAQIFENDPGIENHKEVLRIAAAGDVNEITSFLDKNKLALRDEEIEFLEVAKDFNLAKKGNHL